MTGTSIVKSLNESLKKKIGKPEFTSTLFDNGDGEFYIRGKNNKPAGRIVNVTSLSDERIKIQSVSNSSGFLEDFIDGNIVFSDVEHAATYVYQNIIEE